MSWHARPIFAWYDLWIGAYFDRVNRRLYIFPVPCFGIVVWRERRRSIHQRMIDAEVAEADRQATPTSIGRPVPRDGFLYPHSTPEQCTPTALSPDAPRPVPNGLDQ